MFIFSITTYYAGLFFFIIGLICVFCFMVPIHFLKATLLLTNKLIEFGLRSMYSKKWGTSSSVPKFVYQLGAECPNRATDCKGGHLKVNWSDKSIGWLSMTLSSSPHFNQPWYRSLFSSQGKLWDLTRSSYSSLSTILDFLPRWIPFSKNTRMLLVVMWIWQNNDSEILMEMACFIISCYRGMKEKL